MAFLLLILAAAFWGGNYIVGHIMIGELSPIILSELRWFLTALLLICLYYKPLRKDWSKIKQSFWVIFFLALCGQVLFPLNLYISLQYTTPLNAAIYLSTTPILVLGISKVFFNDSISRANIIGVVLSLIGVVYLILQGNVEDIRNLAHLNQGDLWAIGSAASWGLYCAFLRKKDKNISGTVFVTISSIIGAIVLIPLTLYLFFTEKNSFGAITWNLSLFMGLLYLVICPSWLAYLFWSKGIAQVGAVKGEIYTHLVPFFGGLFSILFLGDKLQTYHWVSLMFIVAGIYLCSKHEKIATPLPLENA
jgi:drug/metabolite transporter (DMT)-like permease